MHRIFICVLNLVLNSKFYAQTYSFYHSGSASNTQFALKNKATLDPWSLFTYNSFALVITLSCIAQLLGEKKHVARALESAKSQREPSTNTRCKLSIKKLAGEINVVLGGVFVIF